MKPFEVHNLTLRGEEGGRELLGRLPGPERILSLTFFVDAEETETCREVRNDLLATLRSAYGESAPPATVVAQPPEDGRAVAVEAHVLPARSGDALLTRKSIGDLAYTVVTDEASLHVHAGGLFADTGDTVAQARAVFEMAQAILDREGMSFGHVVRQWNYIEDFLDVHGEPGRERQRYQEFNDARSSAYGRSEFPAGYPAATGIGQAGGGVAISFVALRSAPDLRVEPVSNPLQIDAHRYSEGVLVGDRPRKAAPLFERAKSVTGNGAEIVFVSGTASIHGEESVAIGDVATQTRTTLENIGTLTPDGRLTSLRAYVKQSGDIPVVRRICEETYGAIPALYVRADVCREELLVEIEGIDVVRSDSAAEERAP